MIQDTITLEGQVYAYAVPWETKRETGLYLPRMTPREKERLLVAHGKNLLVNNGKSLILTFIGTTGAMGASTQYSAILSLGTGSITAVLATDTSVATELYRQAPDANGVVAGASVTITTTVTGTNGNGTLTNVGIYGEGATTGLGTGTLHNKALLAYTKATGTTVFVWVITLNT